VAIDISEPRSPGWWMNRLAKALQADQKRFDVLQAHYEGRPPLAWGSEKTQSRFYRFQQTSRTNFAALIVQAMSERIGLRSITTAIEADADGDKEAWRLVTANDLDIHFPEAARLACRFGRAYLLAQSPDIDEKYSVITAEDPRQMIVERDPANPRRVRAALKLFHDDTYGLDVAILWLPGEKWVATRERKAPAPQRSAGILGIENLPAVSFNARSFAMRDELPDDASDDVDPYWSETYESKTVPVRQLDNRDGVGEYELHLDLLDRINHLSFMLMVIVTLQAFRQRGLKQSADPAAAQMSDRDEDGKVIDYNELFESGPDSLWLLPPGVEVWESAQVSIEGLLNAIKADLLKLSAVTRTPMSMFTPDAASQSAEGAALMREGLIFKVEEFLRAAGRALAAIVAVGFEYMGDEQRSDAAEIEVRFLPAERYSLFEKGQATSQSKDVLPFEMILEKIWQLSPSEIATAKTQRSDDATQKVIAAAMAAAKGASSGDAGAAAA